MFPTNFVIFFMHRYNVNKIIPLSQKSCRLLLKFLLPTGQNPKKNNALCMCRHIFFRYRDFLVNKTGNICARYTMMWCFLRLTYKIITKTLEM